MRRLTGLSGVRSGFGLRLEAEPPRARLAWATAVAALALSGWGVARADDPPDEIVIKDALVISEVGQRGRSAVYTDAVEALLVRDLWAAPVADQELRLPDGTTRRWRAVTSNEDGWFHDAGLQGGYAYMSVSVPQWGAMILDASGHSMVYVNGEPRVGDPYRFGFVQIPILLKRGRNDLLFYCTRGGLRVRLAPVNTSHQLNVGDTTAPDLLVGETVDTWAGVVVMNATPQPLRDARIVASCGDGEESTPIPSVPALSVRKVPFRIRASAPAEPGEQAVQLRLMRGDVETDASSITLAVRRPTDCHKRTFVSPLDGTVQFYAVQPPVPGSATGRPPALYLTLHGAGVDAYRQASCYKPRPDAYTVAPTNRRPYGFDWEDWGRIDALEVLAIAQRTLGTDPLRTYLTGHSMGGHGTWQVAAQHPDRFAAIGPCASWISFWSYVNAPRYTGDSPIEQLLDRAHNTSDTLALSRNYLQHAIYILHGDKDETVPVEQARTMRDHLATFHTRVQYHEHEGGGHWWGDDCMDWPPLMAYLAEHERQPTAQVREIEFVTANPAVSATCHWLTIESQIQWLQLSRVRLGMDVDERLVRGTTQNVSAMSIALRVPDERDPGRLLDLMPPDAPLSVELDGQRIADIPWPAGPEYAIHLVRGTDAWAVATPAGRRAARRFEKTPQRSGPFKQAFANRALLVFGTKGTPQECAWSRAKARYDAEEYWYRGNGAFDVVADFEIVPAAEVSRSIVLYGNEDTNHAWPALLANTPVQITRHAVSLTRGTPGPFEDDDIGVLAVYPRPASEQALVGVIGGTGLSGLRLTERLPYFLAGVAYPDWIVIDARMLERGVDGVMALGFYNTYWNVDAAQTAERKR